MTTIAKTSTAPHIATDDPKRGPDAPLEPTGERPEPTPFKAGVGTWFGVGFGSLAGAAGGGLAMGILGAMAGGLSYDSGAMLPVMLGVGLIGGAIAGGIWAHSGMKSSHEQAERKRIDAEFGMSTLESAQGMITRFDHGDNGRIDLVNTTGLPSMDERIYSETRNRSQKHTKYDLWNDEWRTETERWSESRGTSAANVWAAADVDPKDEVVTDRELARLMSNFDTDRSGTLTTSEREAFSAAHPVIVEGWSR
jgi:hypothetical protein